MSYSEGNDKYYRDPNYKMIKEIIIDKNNCFSKIKRQYLHIATGNMFIHFVTVIPKRYEGNPDYDNDNIFDLTPARFMKKDYVADKIVNCRTFFTPELGNLRILLLRNFYGRQNFLSDPKFDNIRLPNLEILSIKSEIGYKIYNKNIPATLIRLELSSDKTIYFINDETDRILSKLQIFCIEANRIKGKILHMIPLTIETFYSNRDISDKKKRKRLRSAIANKFKDVDNKYGYDKNSFDYFPNIPETIKNKSKYLANSNSTVKISEKIKNLTIDKTFCGKIVFQDFNSIEILEIEANYKDFQIDKRVFSGKSLKYLTTNIDNLDEYTITTPSLDMIVLERDSNFDCYDSILLNLPEYTDKKIRFVDVTDIKLFEKEYPSNGKWIIAIRAKDILSGKKLFQSRNVLYFIL